MSDNIEDIFNKFSNMIKNDEIPDNLKEMLSNIKGSSNSSSNADSSSFSMDPETIFKMKRIMDSINSKQPDPRSNLLLSLKPYLNKSRQKKVDEYIKLFSMEKVFEVFSSLGGEQKNDV